jgi:hypothetical protein
MQLEWSETELKRIKYVYSTTGGTPVITSSGSWGADRVLQHASMDARSSQGEVKAGDELVPNPDEIEASQPRVLGRLAGRGLVCTWPGWVYAREAAKLPYSTATACSPAHERGGEAGSGSMARGGAECGGFVEVGRRWHDKKGENSNLLHERFSKLGAPLTVVLVCFYPRDRYVYIGRKTLHLHVN